MFKNLYRVEMSKLWVFVMGKMGKSVDIGKVSRQTCKKAFEMVLSGCGWSKLSPSSATSFEHSVEQQKFIDLVVKSNFGDEVARKAELLVQSVRAAPPVARV